MSATQRHELGAGAEGVIRPSLSGIACSAARRRDLPQERRCEYCGAPLSGRRRNARYCNETCRSRAWRERRQATPETFQRPSRRPSRDGKGVRVYLTLEDFDERGELRSTGKLDAAYRRLRSREGQA